MPVRNIYHVVAAPKGGWSVIKGGSDRASRRFEIKQDAVAWGRQASRSQGSQLIVHRADGTIESKDFPSRGMGSHQ